MSDITARLGRELARIITTMHEGDRQQRELAEIVDHTFIRYRDRAHIAEALQPLLDIPRVGMTPRSALHELFHSIAGLGDDELDIMCWEYRDERVALNSAVAGN